MTDAAPPSTPPAPSARPPAAPPAVRPPPPADEDATPLPPVLGAPGLGEIGPHSFPAVELPRTPRRADPRDVPRMRTAGGLLVLVGAVGALFFGYLALTVLMAVPWHGDGPGGALTVGFDRGRPLADGSGAVVRIEDLHGDWSTEGQTGALGSFHADLPHAHARVTVEHDGRTWVREVFVPEGGELRLDLDPEDPATADGVVGTPGGAPLGVQAGVGLVMLATGLLVRRGRALGFALLLSWLLGLLATLAGLMLLFLGQPGALVQILVGVGLLWCGWAIQRGREALAAPHAPPAPPTPPAPPPRSPPEPPAAPHSP